MRSLNRACKTILKRRELIGELVERELRDRHTGQVLGVVWAYGHTLLVMVIYTLLFSYVFPTKFASNGVVGDFSVSVLVGVLSWLAFQDILSRAPSILVGHSNLVKQIVFPIEVLPIKTALASIQPYSAGLIFAIVYAGWQGTLTWFSLVLPIVIFFQILSMIGVAFLLSSMGVFLRDLRDIVTVFCSINLFAQPILYNPHNTPEWLEWLFLINPFSYLVWCWQDALYYGFPKHLLAWVMLPMGSLLVFTFGWKSFERMKHAFGDSL